MKWKEQGGGASAVDAGIYDAVCIAIIDVGTQRSDYNGSERIKRECIIEWELVDEIDGEGNRARISQFYNQSLDHRATLRKHLAGWRGRDFTPEELEGFDPKNILGKCCKLVVSVKDNGRNKVDSISNWKGEPEEPSVQPIAFFLTDDDGRIIFDGNFPQEISEGRIKIIKRSDEYNKWADQFSGGATDDDEQADDSEEYDDDIPF